MKVGVVGTGVVGNALIKSFKSSVETLVCDPVNPNSISFQNHLSCEIIFFCLPCPTDVDGTIDVSALEYYLQVLCEKNYGGLAVIKSTLTPNYLNKVQEKYPSVNWIYNPEFVRAEFSDYDMTHPAIQILASNNEKHQHQLEWFFTLYTNIIFGTIIRCDIVTASLIKYFINSWLATKVVFMNEFHALFEHSGSSLTWEKFTNIVKLDTRVGHSHLMVPGSDGKFGFGGMCFPKDTEALLSYARHQGINLDVLAAAVDKNQDLRN